jgi:hypothetical protein
MGTDAIVIIPSSMFVQTVWGSVGERCRSLGTREDGCEHTMRGTLIHKLDAVRCVRALWTPTAIVIMPFRMFLHTLLGVCRESDGVCDGALSITLLQRGWLRAHNAGHSDHKLDAVR